MNGPPLRLGACSICGGDVMGYTLWIGDGSPPPTKCVRCGARPKGDVIDMVPAPPSSLRLSTVHNGCRVEAHNG